MRMERRMEDQGMHAMIDQAACSEDGEEDQPSTGCDQRSRRSKAQYTLLHTATICPIPPDCPPLPPLSHTGPGTACECQ